MLLSTKYNLWYGLPRASSHAQRRSKSRPQTTNSSCHIAMNRHELGPRTRQIISDCLAAIHPYLIFLIPNFKVAHYVYIIVWVILGSIMMYPVKTYPYIDTLFFSTGAATQSGLNTIDVNKLALWQQMCLYILPMFTTPIFIHGSLLFIRLFAFEKYFDDIKLTSKLNHRMRRTMSQATTADSTRLNTTQNKTLGIPMQHLSKQNDSDLESSQSNAISDNDALEEGLHTSMPNYMVYRSNDNITQGNSSSSMSSQDPKSEVASPGIRFGNLPHPNKAKREINPSEMYRSIEMLQQNHKKQTSPPNIHTQFSLDQDQDQDANDTDDEILVIKSPNQIENDEGPIFTKKIQFDRPLTFKVNRNKRPKKGRTLSLTSYDDENRSIDSENAVNDDDVPNIKRATSNLALPTPDKTGHKFFKRANTDTSVKPWKHLTRRISNYGARRKSTDDDEESLFTNVSRTLSNSLGRTRTVNYLSWQPTVGRNSNFVHLTEEQKAELGGVEYRANKLLIKIVWIYYIGFQILALIVYLCWILSKPEHIKDLRVYGISPAWWGVFTGASHFNDLGLTLTPNSMLDFNENYYPMLWGAFFIVIGNTGFPILLRCIIWIMHKFAKPMTLYEESLAFLLDHPRRCFTLLFPSGPTWLLFAILIILNGADLIFFIILDLNNEYLKALPNGYRVVCGLYTAVSTRTAGLTVVNIGELHYAVQVGYIIMMYISVLPIAISIRRTNVYEEQSLGVYVKDQNYNPDDEDLEKSPTNFIGNHLRNQLSFDLWFIFLALFLICICENSKLAKNNYWFSPFTILFEVVSAYGTVGLSLGYPNGNTSLSGEFTTLSKLIMIAVMIRGRHRGLPYGLDRAIMIPNDKMLRKDEVQQHHELRRQETLERQNTQASASGNGLFRAISRKGDDLRRRRSSTSYWLG